LHALTDLRPGRCDPLGVDVQEFKQARVARDTVVVGADQVDAWSEYSVATLAG
jgi:hypothetical protein